MTEISASVTVGLGISNAGLFIIPIWVLIKPLNERYGTQPNIIELMAYSLQLLHHQLYLKLSNLDPRILLI